MIAKIETIQSSLPNQTSGPEDTPYHELHSMLAKITEARVTISREDFILEKLKFDEIHRRELSIEDAHARTFRWLVYAPVDDAAPCRSDLSKSSGVKLKDRERYSHSLEETEREITRDKFLSWLNSGAGIFHISGKAGSGKSTLMKLLSQEQCVEEELKRWAGRKKLLFAKFFFWNPGTELQRSMEGLYRGILWEILRECPQLMKGVFPHVWNDALAPADQRLRLSPFQFSELNVAFQRLVKNESIFEKHSVCLFIDGLDEYTGDYWVLCRHLKEWADGPTISLKICVSSRPYNEFTHAFVSPNQHLQLHDLTRIDVRNFVQDQLENDDRFIEKHRQDARYEKILDAVIEKADGVFLWVCLAVQEVLKGLCNSYSLLQLEEELSQLPSDLETMFRRIIASIHRSDRVRAARHFALAMMNYDSVRSIHTTIAAHSVLDDFYDSEYDMSRLYDPELEAPISAHDMTERFETTKIRLTNRCKGLIQVSTPKARRPIFWSEVQFIHRSVPEFLSLKDVQSELTELCGSFDAVRFTAMAYLRLLKICYNPDDIRNEGLGKDSDFGNYFWIWMFLLWPSIELSGHAELNEQQPLADELQAGHGMMRLLTSCLPPMTPVSFTPWLIPRLGALGYGSARLRSPSNSVELQEVAWMISCIWMNARTFALKNMASMHYHWTPASEGTVLLHATIGVLNSTRHGIQAARGSLMAAIFDAGVISPNTSLRGHLPIQSGTEQESMLPNQNWTVWKLLLLIMCRITMPFKSEPGFNVQSYKDAIHEVFLYYLTHGADTSIAFVGYHVAQNGVSGPCFFDWTQLFEVWDLPNRSELMAILEKNTPSRMHSIHQALSGILWRRPQRSRVPQVETKLLCGPRYFYTVAVVSESDLDKVDYSIPDGLARRWERNSNFIPVLDFFL